MTEIPKPIQDFYNHICDKCGEYGEVYKYSPSEYIKDKDIWKDLQVLLNIIHHH